MSGLDSIVDAQGFYDFLNHIISGSIFIVGSEIVAQILDFSLIGNAYRFIGLWPVTINEFMWNTCVILLFTVASFLIGVVVQALYGEIYEHKHYIRPKEDETPSETATNSQGKGDSDMDSGYVNTYIKRNTLKLFSEVLSRLIRKATIQGCMKNMLTKNGPISNEFKRRRYQELADNFAKPFGIESPVTNDAMLSYFFAYCIYYIQIKSQNRKTEKLRDIEGLSKELSLVFLFLTCFSALAAGVRFGGDQCQRLIAASLLYAFLSIIMDFRTEKSMKNRIRMTLAIYDAEKRQEKTTEVFCKIGNDSP